MAKIVVFGWSLFLQSTTSIHLAPLDYHLFPKLKHFLGDKQFADEEELKAMTLKWFQIRDGDICKYQYR